MASITVLLLVPIACIGLLVSCDESAPSDIQIVINGRVVVVTNGLRVDDRSITEPPDKIRIIVFDVYDSTGLFIDSVSLQPTQIGSTNSHTFRPLVAGTYTITHKVIAVDNTFVSREVERTVL